jgi:GT2 family glycosyltransferase
MSTRVCIIVLNWNGLKDTLECLESLKALTYPNYEVLVVDNASTGGDVSGLKHAFADSVSIIENDRNYSFCEGNNIGIRYAIEHSNPDYFLLLNNDTIVDPGFLSSLISACENDPSIGMAGPKVYFHQDPNVIQSVGGRINWWKGQALLLGNNEVDRGQFDGTGEVDWVSGCALVARRTAIDAIGLLYAPYFGYFEETDWCVRCKRAGYRVMVVPEARVWHKNRISYDVNSATSSPHTYYMTRNRVLFMKRNATVPQFAAFLARLVFREALPFAALALLIQRHNRRLLAPYYRGMRDGLLLVLTKESHGGGQYVSSQGGRDSPA